MATTPSVKVVKSFTFKDNLKFFSNRYHFNTGSPVDQTHWHQLMDNVVAAEKLIFPARVTITEVFGYDAGSDMPVSSKTYSQAGTMSTTGMSGVPGECVALLRWATAARTSKNHPVYLFNYFHGASYDSGVDVDKLAALQRTRIDAYAATWIGGISDGTLNKVRSGPNGANATGSFTEEFLTHRDFPYSPSA